MQYNPEKYQLTIRGICDRLYGSLSTRCEQRLIPVRSETAQFEENNRAKFCIGLFDKLNASEMFRRRFDIVQSI